MKNGFLRIGAVSPKIRVGDVEANVKSCAEAAKRAADMGVKILVYPELCLTGSTAGDLFLGDALAEAALPGLRELADMTAELDIALFVGAPVLSGGRLYNAVCAMSGGVIESVTVKSRLSFDERRHFSEAPRTEDYESGICALREVIYRANAIPELKLAVSVGNELFHPTSFAKRAATFGVNLILNPASRESIAGGRAEWDSCYAAASRELCAAVAVSEAGFGESGTDGVFGGRCAIYSNGALLAESAPFSEGEIVFAEIDCQALLSEKRRRGILECAEENAPEEHNVSFAPAVTELSRPVKSDPFTPTLGAEEYLDEVTELQARALAGRLSRSGSRTLVLGVSGGLDSTHALLVAVRAADILSLPRSAVVSVTMPCFGTTVRTKSNAERLAEALGTDFLCVDIKAAVTQHLSDISQPEGLFDHVYENAQARERTQVLMDIANQRGGIVVGTGDLSELALGWATYNGDHMSMYGVNGGVPKSLMRRLVRRVADRSDEALRSVLLDVLATPVSPELLPPEDGDISQITEDIVGPYELHDFFLYYHVRWGFSAEKILRLAESAFSDRYTKEVIGGWLKVFMRRFFSQQFKRSCLPDGPRVTELSLSPRSGFRIPSDAVGSEWYKKI